jgi:hypothetical protein
LGEGAALLQRRHFRLYHPQLLLGGSQALQARIPL